MKIQTKLIFGASVLIVTGLVCTSVVLGYISSQQSKLALEEANIEKLNSIKYSTTAQLHTYFNQVAQQVKSVSTNQAIIKATKQLRFSFYNYESSDVVTEQKSSVSNYYDNVFLSEYQKLNPNKKPELASLVNQLSSNALALQHEYIAKNKYPFYEKYKLQSDGQFNAYASAHQNIHSELSVFTEQFGFEDVYVVDAKKGDVMYSVNKNIDYAVSLNQGYFADTDLGRAFKEALKITPDQVDTVYLSDFSFYMPSFDKPELFISKPIYEGEKISGVLIFKLSSTKMNQIITYRGDWKKNGLGQTGQTFLVANDRLMRSNSRVLEETPDQYKDILRQQNIEQTSLEAIQNHQTSILLHPVKTPAVDAAIAGSEGTVRFQNYTGYEVISSYSPIELLGNGWVIISQMNYKEATHAAATLSKKLAFSSIITAVIVIIASLFATLLFARSLVAPINKTVDVMKDIAQGEGDLTARLDETRSDEIGELAKWFNTFTKKVQSVILDIKQEAIQLENTSQQMKKISTENTKGATQQQQTIKNVTISMNEISELAENVADFAIDAEKTADTVTRASANGVLVMESTKSSILNVVKNVDEASQTVNELEVTSKTIGSVVGVINAIAEQTNLLALNAAIEAARAGEQGRGFAVVADEVRALASRTQESTLEINSIIETLQKNARAAVTAMKLGNESVELSVQEAEKASESLLHIKQEIINITKLNKQISESAQVQNTASNGAKILINEVNAVSEENQNSSKAVEQNSQDISSATHKLNDLINQFKSE
ncbi:MAG: methyl-accepting chemotaxis protein [Cellvibrionaceae bacterium]|jgi:methyl-accepting chemotaxis protein